MYQRRRSGEIGAAAVRIHLQRCTPISLRTLFRTSVRASQNARRERQRNRPARDPALGHPLADGDRGGVGPALEAASPPSGGS